MCFRPADISMPNPECPECDKAFKIIPEVSIVNCPNCGCDLTKYADQPNGGVPRMPGAPGTHTASGMLKSPSAPGAPKTPSAPKLPGSS